MNALLGWFLLLIIGAEGCFIYHKKNPLCPHRLPALLQTQCGVEGSCCPIGQICCFNGRGTTCACPRGREPVPCIRRPCDVMMCPEFPSATCVNDNCGRCKARFMMSGVLEVTEACKARPR